MTFDNVQSDLIVTANYEPLFVDTDGDGQSDSEELIAGTSPTDASSRFEATISLGIDISKNEEDAKFYRIQVE